MTHRLARYALRTLAAALAVYVAAAAAIFVVMKQPTDRFGRIMAHVPMPIFMVIPFERLWNVARRGALQVGDAAPDFTLRTADKQGSVQLSAFRGKQPVALIFGSYT